MTGMESLLRHRARQTFQRVRERNAQREREQQLPRTRDEDEGRGRSTSPTCDHLIWDDTNRGQRPCGQPATHRGVPPNQLHYCDAHAAWLSSLGKRVTVISHQPSANNHPTLSPTTDAGPNRPPVAEPTRAGAPSSKTPGATISDPDETSPE